MSLMDRIKVKTCYTRATNVERDAGSPAAIATYYPTARGMAVLDDVAAALSAGNMPRAWSLIGPYGSGKSTFAVFLHALLGARSEAATAGARKVLAKQSRLCADRFRRQKPWCRVILTGSPEPLVHRLLTTMDVAAAAFWEGRPGRKPQVLRQIHEACSTPQVAPRHVLTLIDGLQDALERIGAGGLLFVIDELGKFLEFEANQPGAHSTSTNLLQELAERAYLGRPAKLMLFTLQHQAFDMYASGMGEQLQNEWAKAQGRFQMISFIETTEQMLRVLSRAFEHRLTPAEQKQIRRAAAKSAAELADAKALPVGMERAAAEEIFAACYPVHPVSLLALPVLCTRFAQNERTLFTYFGSSEPHGFQQAAACLERVGEWVLPSSVYDYFVQTQPPLAPLARRTWAEVVAAVDQAGREKQQHADEDASGNASMVQLVKSVGLLNLTTGSQGLPASETVLAQLYPTKAALEEALAAPMAASILCYRRFASEYRVSQGTDFNLDEHLTRERDKLGRIDLARVLTERGEAAPIVARRHSIETGALRSFEIAYVDAESGVPSELGGEPRVVVFLAENRADEAAFHSARESAQVSEVWALHKSGAGLRAAIGEVLASERVQAGTQDMATDAVAEREVTAHLGAARAREQQALSGLIRDPSGSIWYWAGERLEVSDRRTLQAALSSVMDSVYSDSPTVRSELVNRDRLSSQAAAARNKLFSYMIDRVEQPGLGIAKYPPEKAIYRSVLEQGRLHVPDDAGKWRLAPPPKADPLRLAPTWARLDALLEASETAPTSTQTLMDELAAPPIGLKRGLFPLIFLHYYLLNRHEIAVYAEGAYTPGLTYEHLERLVRRPDLFTFQRFRVAGVRATLFDEYSQALFGEKRSSLAVLDIARPLTSFLLQLPDYTQKTRRLSETALRVRQALLLAKSPEKLLFEHLPAACGRAGGVPQALTEQEKARQNGGPLQPSDSHIGFAETLIGALRELNHAYGSMVDEMRSALCRSFGCAEDAKLGELRSLALGRCHGLEDYTVDVKGLKSFMRRAAERDQPDQDWLDSILTFLGQKPPAKWTDQDRSTAEYRLAEFSARLLDLQRLKLYYDGRDASEAERLEVILLKTLSKAHGEIDETVPIDKQTAAVIADERAHIAEIVAGFNDERLRLALVAAIAQDHLASRRQPAATERGERDLRRVG